GEFTASFVACAVDRTCTIQLRPDMVGKVKVPSLVSIVCETNIHKHLLKEPTVFEILGVYQHSLRNLRATVDGLYSACEQTRLKRMICPDIVSLFCLGESYPSPMPGSV